MRFKLIQKMIDHIIEETDKHSFIIENSYELNIPELKHICVVFEIKFTITTLFDEWKKMFKLYGYDLEKKCDFNKVKELPIYSKSRTSRFMLRYLAIDHRFNYIDCDYVMFYDVYNRSNGIFLYKDIDYVLFDEQLLRI